MRITAVTLHCLTTLAGMLSAPVAFFYINSVYDFFNSLCCNILKVKIVINIHMIFYFHYTRVFRGVIYHIMPNFICYSREKKRVKVFWNFLCFICDFIVFTKVNFLFTRVTFFLEKKGLIVVQKLQVLEPPEQRSKK